MFFKFGLWVVFCGLLAAPKGEALSLYRTAELQATTFLPSIGHLVYPEEWRGRMCSKTPKKVEREIDGKWKLHMTLRGAINGTPKPRKMHKRPPWYDLFEEEVEKEPLGPPCKNLAQDVIEGKRRLRFTLKRSNRQMCATIVDDVTKQTHCFLSTNFKYLSHIFGTLPTKNAKITRNKGGNVKAAYELGKLIGRQALSRGISKVFFDRAKYR